MLTVICEKPGLLVSRDTPKPARGEGETLIRIRRVGVCGTDLHIYEGNQPYLEYPRVMGHEISGVVEETDDSGRLQAGDVVYVVPYLSCGQCIACRQGKTNCCTRIAVLGVHRDGALTEYLSLPDRFVFKAEGLGLAQAAMVEVLAIGAHAVRRSGLGQAQRVAWRQAAAIGGQQAAADLQHRTPPRRQRLFRERRSDVAGMQGHQSGPQRVFHSCTVRSEACIVTSGSVATMACACARLSTLHST